jgi:hypothetical protein
MDWASIRFALYDAWVDNAWWTGLCWRLPVAANLPVPWLESALPAAWTRTCSARCLNSDLLCPLPRLELDLPSAWTQTCSACFLDSDLLCTLHGLELALPTAYSFLDHRIFCQAVFCGPTTRFHIGLVRLLHTSYSCNIATSLYIPHTHLTPVLFLQFGNWQLMCSRLGRYWNDYCQVEAVSVFSNWENKLYSSWEETTEFIVLTLELLTDLACLTSSLRVPCQSCGTSIYNEHCHYSIRPNHWHDLQKFQLKITCF